MSTTIDPNIREQQDEVWRRTTSVATDTPPPPNVSAHDGGGLPVVADLRMLIRIHGHTVPFAPECDREHLRWQVRDPYRRIPGGRQRHLFEYPAVQRIGPILGLPKFEKGNTVGIGGRSVPFRHRGQVETLVGTPTSFGIWRAETFAVSASVNGQPLIWVPPYVLVGGKSTQVLIAGYRSERGSMLEPLIQSFVKHTGWLYSPSIADWCQPLYLRLVAGR